MKVFKTIISGALTTVFLTGMAAAQQMSFDDSNLISGTDHEAGGTGKNKKQMIVFAV